MNNQDSIKTAMTSSESVSEILKQLWPERAEVVVDLLRELKEIGCQFCLFNLPINYTAIKVPTDLDIMLDEVSYKKATTLFLKHELLALDHKVGTNQKVFVMELRGHGFFRLHLHSDLSYFGKRWLDFDSARIYMKLSGEFLVPTAELDIYLLHLQWFFKRKEKYPGRITEVFKAVDEQKLLAMAEPLFGKRQQFVEQLIERCHNRCSTDIVSQLALLIRNYPFTISIYLHYAGKLLDKLRPKMFGRRRGLFVYLMGIDGTGKTTIATAVKQAHDDGGLISRYVYLGLKDTLVQQVRSKLLAQNDRERFDGQSGVADRLAKSSSFLSNLFNFSIALVYLIEYQIKMIRLLRFVRTDNNLVIVDRAYYDKLTERHKWGNSLFYYLLPKPDMVIALHGDLQVLYDRKHEFEVDVLERMQSTMDAAWSFLESREVLLLRIDSSRNQVGSCVEQINDRLYTLVKSNAAKEIV